MRILKFFTRYSHVNWALIDQAIVSGANFLTGILLGRYLGIEEFGRFTLAWMVVLFFNSLQLAIIIAPLMSIGPKQNEEEKPSYFGAVLLQQVLWATASFALLLLGVWGGAFIFAQRLVLPLALPLASALFAFQIQDFLRRYFFVRGHARLALLNDIISYLGQLLLLAVFFHFSHLGTEQVLWVIAGTSAAAVLVGLFSLETLDFSRTVLCSVCKRHWRFAKWLLGSALLQWASGNFFLAMAGSVLGAGPVGAIKAGQNIFGVTHVLFQGLENVVPASASLHYEKGGIEALTGYLRRVSWIGGGGIILFILAIVVRPEMWLSLVYGEQFSGFGFVLIWFAPIYLCIFLSLPLKAGLRALELTRVLFYAYIAMTTFSMIFAYHAVHLFGVNGVMLGILITQLISLVVCIIYFVKRANDLKKLQLLQ